MINEFAAATVSESAFAAAVEGSAVASTAISTAALLGAACGAAFTAGTFAVVGAGLGATAYHLTGSGISYFAGDTEVAEERLAKAGYWGGQAGLVALGAGLITMGVCMTVPAMGIPMVIAFDVPVTSTWAVTIGYSFMITGRAAWVVTQVTRVACLAAGVVVATPPAKNITVSTYGMARGALRMGLSMLRSKKAKECHSHAARAAAAEDIAHTQNATVSPVVGAPVVVRV